MLIDHVIGGKYRITELIGQGGMGTVFEAVHTGTGSRVAIKLIVSSDIKEEVFVRFQRKPADGSLEGYGGRPDGATVDAEGCYWVAMYEGGRVLRFSPGGELLREVLVPALCPTMPCFGGPDLKTVYVTSASINRSAEELARWPDSGCVFAFEAEVAGLPVAQAATPPPAARAS